VFSLLALCTFIDQTGRPYAKRIIEHISGYAILCDFHSTLSACFHLGLRVSAVSSVEFVPAAPSSHASTMRITTGTIVHNRPHHHLRSLSHILFLLPITFFKYILHPPPQINQTLFRPPMTHLIYIHLHSTSYHPQNMTHLLSPI
jgi:hypothetical protein